MATKIGIIVVQVVVALQNAAVSLVLAAATIAAATVAAVVAAATSAEIKHNLLTRSMDYPPITIIQT